MKFSIAIPAYKPEYLDEAVSSVFAQTFGDWELIVVDDASPADLRTIMAPYLADPRVQYYRNEQNFGSVNVVNNWNRCLEYCKGDYVICMGDDDKLLPNCLADYAALIAEYPGLGVYHARTEIIDEHSRFSDVTASRCAYESVYSFIWHRWNARFLQYVGDFLYETEALRKNGGFYFLPLAWGSDDITAIIAAREKGIANTLQPGFCYRINPATISKAGDIIVKMQAIQKEEEWIESFLDVEPEDELDKKYWICLRRQRVRYFEKKKGLTIARDLKDHSWVHVFPWIVRRKRFGLNLRTLLYAIVEALK